MNRNAVVGIGLVVVAVVAAGVLAASQGGAVEGLLGKSLWYLPYVAAVGGVRKLVRARNRVW